jgi:hypothetical protein
MTRVHTSEISQITYIVFLIFTDVEIQQLICMRKKEKFIASSRYNLLTLRHDQMFTRVVHQASTITKDIDLHLHINLILSKGTVGYGLSKLSQIKDI